MRNIWTRALLFAACCALMLAACSQASPEKQDGSASKYAGNWDASMKNNENPSLGAKTLSQTSQPVRKVPTVDSSMAHDNVHLAMNRDLADQLMKAAHVGSAAVALAGSNIYVAVQQTGQDPQQTSGSENDSAAGAGLFGSGKGAQLDWVSSKPLSPESSQAIRSALRRAYPEANVYISTNPHFVSRMLFYDKQQRERKTMDGYLNEFNTMVQHAFPDYTTGQKRLIP